MVVRSNVEGEPCALVVCEGEIELGLEGLRVGWTELRVSYADSSKQCRRAEHASLRWQRRRCNTGMFDEWKRGCCGMCVLLEQYTQDYWKKGNG